MINPSYQNQSDICSAQHFLKITYFLWCLDMGNIYKVEKYPEDIWKLRSRSVSICYPGVGGLRTDLHFHTKISLAITSHNKILKSESVELFITSWKRVGRDKGYLIPAKVQIDYCRGEIKRPRRDCRDQITWKINRDKFCGGKIKGARWDWLDFVTQERYRYFGPILWET